MGKAHPKKPKKFKKREGYRKFIAYTHMRTVTGLPVFDSKGKRIKGRKSISEVTPTRRKEKVVEIAGKKHRPVLTDKRGLPKGDSKK